MRQEIFERHAGSFYRVLTMGSDRIFVIYSVLGTPLRLVIRGTHTGI
jgi:hypothetical protein